MRILMNQTLKGSPNGLGVFTYLSGKEYDIPESLYKVFKKIGACADVEVKRALVPDNKMALTPDNKSIQEDLGADELDDELDENLNVEEDESPTTNKRSRKRK